MIVSAGVENAEVARLFRELADLLEIEGANPFRVRAYRNAARTVEDLPEPIEEWARRTPQRLKELPGIGDDLAEKIVEIVETGKLGAIAEAGRATPKHLPDLLRIRGLGPKRVRALHDALGVKTLKQLERAAKAGRVRAIRGFGAKTEARILEALAHRAASDGDRRFLRPVAAEYGETFLRHLRRVPGVRRAEIAGSFRRRRETVGDLDILVDAEDAEPVADAFVTYPEVEDVLEHGATRSSVRLRSGLQVDLRVLPAESYGAGLHYFTGSKAHNIAIRRLGRQRGLKVSEYGVFRGARRVGGATEEEIFRRVGLSPIPPELREDRGEIEAAAAKSLPALVALDDVRGDLQMHTTDSDGRDTLEAMADAAEAMGYEYIAVTDHSPALRMVRGLDRAGFRRQMARIDTLNARRRKLTILRGAEVDIRPDGSLDLDDGTLAALDLVVVSIHSRFELPPRQQTERLARALAHPSVDVLGHPTARLLGRRPPVQMDRDRVLRAAADHGVLVEVNAQPERLDLDDVGVRAAIALGIKLVISSDAHGVNELRHMRWGVDQARRGWATKRDVANTLPVKRFLRLLHRGRN